MEVNAGTALAEPSPLPTEWHTVLLDSVAKRGSGHTPSKSRPEYWNGDVQWVSLADSAALDHVYIEDTSASISEAGLQNSSAVMHAAGTVVLSRDAGVGKSAILRTDMAVSQHFMAWLCGPELHNFYLYYWLQSRKPDFERIAAGSTIKTIGLPYFQSLEVVKPPLLEQQAIAKALTDADTLIDSLEQLLTKQRQIKQGAMQELLTGKRRLPGFGGAWATKSLSELGTFHKGAGVRRDQAASGNLPCVRYGEIYTAHEDHVRAFHSWISPEVAATATRLQQGDLLFAGSGETKEEIGKCVAFLDECEAYVGGDIVILRPSAKLSAAFMGYALNSPLVIRQKASRGQGDAVVHISSAALGSVSLLLPEAAEQHAIALVLTDMDTSLTALQARLTKARQLKQALMQVLLTGRIRLVAPGAAAAAS